MDILILGGAGMLGHKLFQRLRKTHASTSCTIRGSICDCPIKKADLFRQGNVIENCDFCDFPAVQELLNDLKPNIVINCIGVIKQRAAAKDPIPSIEINALLPHRLATLCKTWDGRLIHFSTDCVFSGKRGTYTEDDCSDAEDLYGQTKFLGEVTTPNAITLRTSIIGRELAHGESLLEWFLRQNHERVSGYTRAIFSGVTTVYMSGMIERLITDHPNLSGLYQVTGPPISKHHLLCLLRDAYRLDVDIIPDETFHCDRSMKGDRFARATGYISPEWPELVSELANDETPYQEWK